MISYDAPGERRDNDVLRGFSLVQLFVRIRAELAHGGKSDRLPANCAAAIWKWMIVIRRQADKHEHAIIFPFFRFACRAVFDDDRIEVGPLCAIDFDVGERSN